MVARDQRGGLCENRWGALRSRVMGCDEDREAARSARREAQQGVKCWGYGDVGHCLWACPNKAAYLGMGNAQHGEKRKLVVETERRDKVKRKWQTKEKEVANRGQLVERNERGWIETRRGEYCAVSGVTCGYCGEEGTAEGGNFVRLECVHDMWCERCKPKKEWLDREVATRRKSKIRCTACRKKWVAAKKVEVEAEECRECEEERRGKEGVQPREVKAQQAEKEGERDLRHTLRPLNEVWMTIGMEKVDTYEGVTVKALLDSGAIGMFADKKFVEKNEFKLEKLERAVRIKNVDRTKNSGGMVMHEIECNVYYKGHVEQMQLDVCDLGRTEVILGMPWLAAHNPEIDWEKGEIKMTRCPLLCGKSNKVKKDKEKKEAMRRRQARRMEKEKAINWAADEKEDWGKEEEMELDHRKIEGMVPKKFHRWLKVFGKVESERMPVRKVWDHVIDLKKDFNASKAKVYPLSRNERDEVQEFVEEHLRKGYIRPSKLQQTSLVFFVGKKDVGKWMVMDYRGLNKQTVKNNYPLPLITELVDNMGSK